MAVKFLEDGMGDGAEVPQTAGFVEVVVLQTIWVLGDVLVLDNPLELEDVLSFEVDVLS